ncbi:hypothetical protein CYLTODRAFT_449958 [Cylindrobasidium torrendii FP15055 ss-10]|uniref:Conidiation protein 6 n=1 Tax=Cylindrobasidium torrendii FP15055 ss-10 TaxID=1314674 RepID=A0A0D7BPQ9_9AGAR|nr:hypothetical protein CYLTODRAFT_449958 [Cylindrobasidium torrendii FP15055 ss-10]
MSDGNKNPERVAAGLKAAIHNPNTSDEARERATERLQGIDTQYTDKNLDNSSASMDNGDHHRNQVLGGYKATLHNPGSTDAAKSKARDVLQEAGVGEERLDQRSGKADPERVAAGHRAAIKNPNVSDEAKQHSQNFLDDNEEYED